MYAELENIIYSYLDLDDILRLPERSKILQTPHFKTYNWLYCKFGLITDHYKNQLLKNDKIRKDFLWRCGKYWRYKELGVEEIQLMGNTKIILEDGHGENLGNYTYNIESLKNIILDIVKSEIDDSVGVGEYSETHNEEETEQFLETQTTAKLNSLYKKEIFDYINQLINNEYERGDIHPQYYLIGYLCSGILYDKNWESLVDIDIDKFAWSYGIDLKLSRAEKIREIIKGQNLVLKQILDSGEDGECRSCPIIKKLIQKVTDEEILVDSQYRDSNFLDGYAI